MELVLPSSSGGFRRAVSRILSARQTPGRESFVSAASTRNPFRSAEPKRAVSGSPIWPCTQWGFPCLRAYAWSGGLLPRLFTLTANLESLNRSRRRSIFCGTLRRDALRRHLPHVSGSRLAPGEPVTRHRALWCSDFPPRSCERGDSPPFQNRQKYTINESVNQ